MSEKVPDSFKKLMKDIGIGEIEEISIGNTTYYITNGFHFADETKAPMPEPYEPDDGDAICVGMEVIESKDDKIFKKYDGEELWLFGKVMVEAIDE